MRTVTLEILRHGPPSNQLLSPLTRYLALCGNHPAETLELPYEHSQFLLRLQSLQYKDDDKTREMQLTETGKELGRLLSEIPGLVRELGDSTQDQGMTHLRLILSANELSLLPFELLQSPNGFPGPGQPLVLQTDAPVCITREVRRIREQRLRWDREPKILFAAAAPPGLADVPLWSNLLALRQAVSPWVLPYDPDDPEEIKKSVGAHLTVLPNADARSIEEACSTGKYTHVHILAHGVPYTKREDRRYGIALHDSRDPNRMDIVEGDRLATLLRAQEDRGKCRLSRPDVVTLASCESGQVGSVVGAGASVAHALHEAGIPLVVASQFPLSFDGSVLMIKLLYEGLLSGEDPRCLIDNLRRQLRVRVPKTHDWASVVAYASFPENLEDELSQLRIIQAKRALSAALKHASEAVEEMSARTAKFAIKRGRRWDRSKDAPTAALALPREKVDKAKARMADLFKIEKAPENRVSLLGQLASAEKQEAEILARAAHHELFAHYYEGELEDTKTTDLTNARTGLERSRCYYEEAFEVDPSQSWCLGSVKK